MKGVLKLLGTGGSMGIPVIGCECNVCRSTLPYNKRLRPGALIQIGGKNIIIDAGPDFRTQALKHRIHTLDGALITHAHHDHTAGIDDLRVYSKGKKTIPCLMSLETHNDLKSRYDYIFNPNKDSKTLLTRFEIIYLENDRGEIEFCGQRFKYFSYQQGGMTVNGFCIGDLAFISDIKDFSEKIFDDIRGIKTLVVSALRFTPSHLHFTVDDAIDFAEKAGAKQTWLTHIAHDLDYEQTNAYLPSRIRMGYDGLEIPFWTEAAC